VVDVYFGGNRLICQLKPYFCLPLTLCLTYNAISFATGFIKKQGAENHIDKNHTSSFSIPTNGVVTFLDRLVEANAVSFGHAFCQYVCRLYEQDELYDLQNDPAELYTRIDDPTLAGVMAEFKERLLTFHLETGDVVPHDPDHR